MALGHLYFKVKDIYLIVVWFELTLLELLLAK